MRFTLAIGTLLLLCGSMLAQTSSTTQTTTTTTQTPPAAKSQATTPRAQRMAAMKEHMQQMKTDLQQMKSKVEKMRSDAAKVSDANVKTILLDNADLWDSFITRMQSHMEMMGTMQDGAGEPPMRHRRARPTTDQTPPPTPPQ